MSLYKSHNTLEINSKPKTLKPPSHPCKRLNGFALLHMHLSWHLQYVSRFFFNEIWISATVILRVECPFDWSFHASFLVKHQRVFQHISDLRGLYSRNLCTTLNWHLRTDRPSFILNPGQVGPSTFIFSTLFRVSICLQMHPIIMQSLITNNQIKNIKCRSGHNSGFRFW